MHSTNDERRKLQRRAKPRLRRSRPQRTSSRKTSESSGHNQQPNEFILLSSICIARACSPSSAPCGVRYSPSQTPPILFLHCSRVRDRSRVRACNCGWVRIKKMRIVSLCVMLLRQTNRAGIQQRRPEVRRQMHLEKKSCMFAASHSLVSLLVSVLLCGCVEQRLDFWRDLFGLGGGSESLHHLALAIHQKLLKVPLDTATAQAVQHTKRRVQ